MSNIIARLTKVKLTWDYEVRRTQMSDFIKGNLTLGTVSFVVVSYELIFSPEQVPVSSNNLNVIRTCPLGGSRVSPVHRVATGSTIPTSCIDFATLIAPVQPDDTLKRDGKTTAGRKLELIGVPGSCQIRFHYR